MAETVNQEMQSTEEKTFTQAEMEKIIGERLFREREKYSDYDALKEKASKLDQLEEASKTELQKVTEKAAALEAELNGLKKAEAIRTIREKVAKETGVPMNLLTAETEEECKAQAETVKAYITPGYPTVKDQGEATKKMSGSTRDQFAAWASEAFS